MPYDVNQRILETREAKSNRKRLAATALPKSVTVRYDPSVIRIPSKEIRMIANLLTDIATELKAISNRVR